MDEPLSPSGVPAARSFSAAQVAEWVGGEVVGEPSARIVGISSIDGATSGDITFAGNGRYLMLALRTSATAILVCRDVAAQPGRTVIRTDDPTAAFARVLEEFEVKTPQAAFRHPTSYVHDTAEIGANVYIDAFASVDADARIGDNTFIGAGCRIGSGCQVGSDTQLFGNVVLYPGTSVGSRCRLHGGVVIGGDGFGYVQVGGNIRKVPHLGTVEIHDDVEIGANSCVDKAKTGATVIGAGTKIDNLVQIGHNVRIGRLCLITALTGIGGSARLGDGCVLAAQVGVKDHAVMGDRTTVGARAAVLANTPPGSVWWGWMGGPAAHKKREFAALSQLPKLIERVRALEALLADVESKDDAHGDAAQ